MAEHVVFHSSHSHHHHQRRHHHHPSPTQDTTTTTIAERGKKTTKPRPQVTWLVVACLLLLVHLHHVTANVSFATGMVRLNKTRLDEIQKRAWINKLSKILRGSGAGSPPASGDGMMGQRDRPATPGSGEGGGRWDGDGAGRGAAAAAAAGNGGRGQSDQGPSPSFLPVFVFSKSPGNNVLEFELNRNRTSNMPDTMAKVNLYLYVWKQRESRRSRRNRRRSKRHRFIRLRVFQVNERNRKKKRIAELRKRVHRSHWHRLSLPVSLVQSMWQAHNGTLKLRVKCKRCSDKVRLVMPSDSHTPCPQKPKKNKKIKNKNKKKPAKGQTPGLLHTLNPPPVRGKRDKPQVEGEEEEEEEKKEKKSARGAGAGRRRRRKGRRRKGRCGPSGVATPGHVPFLVIENKPDGLPAPSSPAHHNHHHSLPAAGGGDDGDVAAPATTSPSQSSLRPFPAFSPRNASRHARSATRSSSSSLKAKRLAKGSVLSTTVVHGLEKTKAGASVMDRSLPRRWRPSPNTSPLPPFPRRTRHGRSVSDSSSEDLGVRRVCSNPHPRHRSCCVVALPVDPTEFNTGVSIVAPSTLTLTTCEGQCHSSTTRHHHHRRRPRVRVTRRRGGGGGGRGKRRKSRQWTCEPAASQPLSVWYFDHNHNLAHAVLPGMLITECGCRRN
ncbi:uncharacterized protein LOC143294045 [Babylonia areolata]|uniref:uncharacterized protein LOC143294045 n=1 Tax=Babylonia areolata TaxID=304850 RepID=UPI003FD1B65C